MSSVSTPVHKLTISSKCLMLSQFVTDGTDQSIIKPVVEYCVVCGDKASGEEQNVKHTSVICFRIYIPAADQWSCSSSHRAPLWSGELRGLQGLLQAQHQEEPGVHVQGLWRVCHQQAPQKPLPVLSTAALHNPGHEAGL